MLLHTGLPRPARLLEVSPEPNGILGAGVALLVGLGGLILTIGGWLRADTRALHGELQVVGKRVARLEGLIEGSGLFHLPEHSGSTGG